MSITKVAEIAGVSTATVSRVLNNRSVVADDTVKKVEEAIRQAGYNALPVAERRGPKSMMHVPLRYRAFAYIWTGRAETGLKAEENAQTRTGHQLLEGASAALRKLRISLVVDYLSGPGYVPPLVEEERLDGLLLQGTEPPPAIAEKLRRFPVVWIFYQGSHEWGDRVQPDHRAVGRMAMDYLAEHGSVCCMTFRPRWPVHDYYVERSDAFVQQAKLRDVPCVTLGERMRVPETDADRAAAAVELVKQFAKLSPRPRGLFVAHSLGGHIHEQLRANNIEPMKDVILVSGDKERCPPHLAPYSATIDIHSQEISRLAVDLLLWRISNPDAPRVAQLVQPSLIIPS